MSKNRLDPLSLVASTYKIDEKIKNRILVKSKFLRDEVSEIERLSGVSYPTYYVEPTLTVSVASDNYGGIGILYARTIPLETGRRIEILVQVSAALVIYASRQTLRRVLAHEFLHYLELVKKFSSGQISSELSSESMFEERFEDGRRVIDANKIFSKRWKLAKDLNEDFEVGFSDDKLNEKCRKFWIEKGLPTVKISMAANQSKISMESLTNTRFDPGALKLLSDIV